MTNLILSFVLCNFYVLAVTSMQRRLSVSVCSKPDIRFRDQNLQSDFAYGFTGFEWFAAHFHSMHHRMPDAYGVAGFIHNLRGGKWNGCIKECSICSSSLYFKSVLFFAFNHKKFRIGIGINCLFKPLLLIPPTSKFFSRNKIAACSDYFVYQNDNSSSVKTTRY